MTRIVLLLVASLTVQLAHAQAPAPAASPPNPYILADDRKIEELAKKKSKELCADVKPTTDWEPSRAERKQQLKDDYLGSSNKLLEAMKASDEVGDIGGNLQTEVTGDPEWIVRQAFPLVCFFVSLIIYYCCCWTACPCCRCCRCCKKEQQNSKVLKLIGLIFYSACVLAVVAMGSMAMGGLEPVGTGVDNMACTSAKLVNESLSGKDATGVKFIGFIPMLELFSGLQDELKAGSTFNTNVGNIVDQTLIIDDAVKVTSAMYKLLEDAISAVPGILTEINDANPGSIKHKCTACTEVTTALQAARATLDGSVADQLVQVRASVKDQLQGEGATSMSDMMGSAAAPMVSMKDLIVSSLGGFLDSGIFEDGATYIENYGLVGVLALIGLVLLVSTCGFYACISWVLCETKSDDPAAPANPYNKSIPDCACKTWCCAFPVLWLVCWIGGLLSIVVGLTATLCDILDDISGTMIQDIGGPVGLNTSADGMGTLTDMVDKCFNPPEINGVRNYSANLLDLVIVNETTNATMRDEVVVAVKDAIMKSFDDLAASMDSGGGESMVDSTEVEQLRTQLIKEPFPTWIIPDVPDPTSNSVIQDMASSGDSRLAAATTLKTSLFCVDHTPAALADTDPLQGVYQIDNFVTGNLDPAKCPGGDCTQTGGSYTTGFTCSLTDTDKCYYDCIRPTDCATTACAAASTFLQSKAQLVEAKKYFCNVFEKDDGSECDPLDSPTYDPTTCCQGGSAADGRDKDTACTLKVKEKLCSMKEFTDYIRRFGVNAPTLLTQPIGNQPGTVAQKTGRVARCMVDMDAHTTNTQDKINVDLKDEVKGTFLDKIDEFADGAGCGFLGILFREMIDGLCYAGCWGLGSIAQAYVGSIFCLLAMILLAYILWRKVQDNYDLWKPGLVAGGSK